MITRSKQTISATVNGQKTKLALSLKDGCAMVYWYWIQLPCGGWREFDVRQVCDVPGNWIELDLRTRFSRLPGLIADKNVFEVAMEA